MARTLHIVRDCHSIIFRIVYPYPHMGLNIGMSGLTKQVLITCYHVLSVLSGCVGHVLSVLSGYECSFI